MMVKRIVVNVVGRSRRFEKRYAERSGGMCCTSGGVCCLWGVMRRRVSTRITFGGVIDENRAQTSGLLHAAVCFVRGLHLNQYCSRARRITRDHEEPHGGVKIILFRERCGRFRSEEEELVYEKRTEALVWQ
ncbi:hypothetical protein Pan241w_41240 [Gimesia alba]|uniref:Uncharacterized protein n=1 Tax=Gimesia alba TaxID=2527973 RepID=A0A517RJH9_9PLAN|nr:hypothetical protein Pan241w_41240 [Gimesia alba]